MRSQQFTLTFHNNFTLAEKYCGLAYLTLIRMNLDKSASPRVVFESQPAGESSDTSTVRTVQMMCDYVRQGVDDPAVQSAARYAFDHFACGRRDPAMLAWAVFWYVKHCVSLRQDEVTMFRIGAQNQFDLLIAPSVLVRMKDPAEDCDGFTMLCAALCSILGLPVFIATAAVSPDDPSRWSHVFPCAMVNGAVVPLDASHGKFPGWMVPRSRIYRFQAWSLDAKPVDIGISKFQGLHGYVRRGRGRRGMGDDVTDQALIDAGLDPTDYLGTTGGGTLVNGVLQSTPGPASSSSSFDFGTFFNSLFGNAAKVAAVVDPVPTYRLPNGTIVTGVPPSQAASLLSSTSLTSALPVIGLGIAALVVVSMMNKK